MSHAAVVQAFPRRPLALVPDPNMGKSRRLWLIVILLLFLPGLYWAWSLQSNGALKQDLLDRGVEAEVLSADGSCWSRRQISGDEPRGCNYEIEYALQPEHGGGTRRADVRLDGARPIFTPAALYDPENPDRVMFRPEAERSLRWQEWIAIPILLLIPLAGLILWWLARKDPLEAALAAPEPVTVPVARFTRLPKALQVWFHREPGAAKEYLHVFPDGSDPFLLHDPSGDTNAMPWALALLTPKGRPILLDRELSRIQLSNEERARLLGGP